MLDSATTLRSSRSIRLAAPPSLTVFCCIVYYTDRGRPAPVAERIAVAEMGGHARRDGARDQDDHGDDMRQGGGVFRAREQYVPYRGDCSAGMEHSNDQLCKYNTMLYNIK